MTRLALRPAASRFLNGPFDGKPQNDIRDPMTLPNFLIIGAAKSGTSSLYSYLGQHPQIYTSPKKGPCFFAFEENQKVEVFGPGDQEVFDRNVITDPDAYQALFNGVSDEKAFGEASVLYLYAQAAPTRIKRYIPKVKLITVLRNPVDRAFSSFSHLRRDGREPLDQFAEALKAEGDRVNARWQHLWHYTRLGFYYAQLSRYFELFPREQIAVYTYDQFTANPIEVLQDIFCFLEIDSAFVPDTSLAYNISGMPKLKALHAFLTKPSRVKSMLKPFLPHSWRKRSRAKALAWNTAIAGRPVLSQETRRWLIELYRDDILKLQSLIRQDLSRWLQ